MDAAVALGETHCRYHDDDDDDDRDPGGVGRWILAISNSVGLRPWLNPATDICA